jgi:adenine/guanine phosphoribosyltransferase-like PRPP-binding protein
LNSVGDFPIFVFDGAIAQLGERLNGIQKVRGSTPLSSTITSFNPRRNPVSQEPSTLFYRLTILGETMFRDRQDAAVKLAERLLDYKNKDCVILAIPRGGVTIGYHLARRLNLPLDVIISRKLTHPLSPEYAIGAVSAHGEIISDYREVSDYYIESEVKRLR